MSRSIPLLVAAFLILCSSYCGAQQSCLDIADSKLAIGSKIKVYPVEGERFSGTLESVDLQMGLLNVLLAESDKVRGEASGDNGSGPVVMSLEATEISKITYRRRGRLQPDLIGLMTLGFGVLGGVLYYQYEEEGGTHPWTFYGAALGAGVGLVVGTSISLLTPSTSTIDCNPPQSQ